MGTLQRDQAIIAFKNSPPLGGKPEILERRVLSVLAFNFHGLENLLHLELDAADTKSSLSLLVVVLNNRDIPDEDN